MIVGKNIKVEIAESLIILDKDPFIFIDLFFEQYGSQILKESNQAIQKQWLEWFWRDPQKVAQNKFDINSRFNDAMNLLNKLEIIVSDPANSSDWTSQSTAQILFDNILSSIKDLRKNSNLILNTGKQIQINAMMAAGDGQKNINFQSAIFDKRTLDSIKKIKSIDELNSSLDQINDETKQKLIMTVKSENINDPKYNNAKNAKNYLDAYANPALKAIENKLLKFSNNDATIAENILMYLLEKSSIPEFLTGDVDTSLIEKIKNSKSLEELSNLVDALNNTEKAKISQFAKDINANNPEILNAHNFYNTTLKSTKYGDLVRSLINKIKTKFGITDKNHAYKLLLYLLYTSPILELIKSGKSDAYGGSDPMKNITSFDDIANYFDSLSDDKKGIVGVMASNANPSTEPIQSGLKAFADIQSEGYIQILNRAYRIIYDFTQDDKETNNILSFILGQTKLVKAIQYALMTIVFFNDSYKNNANHTTKRAWNSLLWPTYKQLMTNNESTLCIFEDLIESYFRTISVSSCVRPRRKSSRKKPTRTP
jgi:hypothetical protein